MILTAKLNLRSALLLLTCCLLALSTAAAQRKRITLFEDDFESYTNAAAFSEFWGYGSGSLETNIPGGGKAMLHHGLKYNFHKDLKNIRPDEKHHLILSADFYDFATNSERRVAVMLTNRAGDCLAIGCIGAHPYGVRATFLPGQTNWVAIRRGQVPLAGWHHIEVVLSLTNLVATLDLGAKGKIDKRVSLPFTTGPDPFTEIRIGRFSPSAKWHGAVLVDNIRVELVPASAKIVAAAPRKNTTPLPASDVGLTAPEKLASSASTSAPAVSLSTNQTAQTPSAVIAKELELASAQLATSSPAQKRNRSVRSSPEAEEVPQSVAPTSSSGIDGATAVPANGAINPLWWILGALAAIFMLLIYVVMVLRRSAWGNAAAIQANLLPAPTQRVQLPATTGETELPVAAGNEPWKKRALDAEALAAKQAQILGEKVGPELVEFAKETLVQGLYTQRSALLETQGRAQTALLELEKRLAELDLPVQERIQAYESRITELEKELESRNDEMRELTRATLILIRKKVEEEKAEGADEPRLN